MMLEVRTQAEKRRALAAEHVAVQTLSAALSEAVHGERAARVDALLQDMVNTQRRRSAAEARKRTAKAATPSMLSSPRPPSLFHAHCVPPSSPPRQSISPTSPRKPPALVGTHDGTSRQDVTPRGLAGAAAMEARHRSSYYETPRGEPPAARGHKHDDDDAARPASARELTCAERLPEAPGPPRPASARVPARAVGGGVEARALARGGAAVPALALAAPAHHSARTYARAQQHTHANAAGDSSSSAPRSPRKSPRAAAGEGAAWLERVAQQVGDESGTAASKLQVWTRAAVELLAQDEGQGQGARGDDVRRVLQQWQQRKRLVEDELAGLEAEQHSHTARSHALHDKAEALERELRRVRASQARGVAVALASMASLHQVPRCSSSAVLRMCLPLHPVSSCQSSTRWRSASNTHTHTHTHIINARNLTGVTRPCSARPPRKRARRL